MLPLMVEGKIGLITGAGQGIGRAIAVEMARQGAAAIAVVDRSAETAAQTAGLAREAGADAEAIVCDLRDRDQIEAMVDGTVARFGGLDVLVNNAGISGRLAPVEATTPEDLREVYETNVLGPVRVTQAFRPLLERSSAPVIVNVSSGMGSIAITNDPERVESGLVNLAYSSSKTALNMLTTQYAKAHPGIRVNAVDPGYTATDFNGHSGPQSVEEGAEAIVEMATIGPDGPTGTFIDRHGVVPW
jgi:NAD(P)-dependent dehydrogenase (short-subunit alcohol dehydrogenase family)